MQLGFVRYEMKQRIKHGIAEEDRLVLKITPEIEANPEIFIRIHSREFRYLGEMYDVLKTENSGDTTFYTCIHDVKESGLFKNLDALVYQHLNDDTHQKQGREFMLTFFGLDYLGEFKTDVKIRSVEDISYAAYLDGHVTRFAARLFRPPIG